MSDEKKERPEWMEKLLEAPLQKDCLIMSEGTFKMLLQDSALSVEEGTMDDETYAGLEKVFSESIERRDAALRKLRALPSFPGSLMATTSLPNEEDLEQAVELIREPETAAKIKELDAETVPEPSMFEDVERIRKYTTPQHLQGVPWTKLSRSYMARVAPHVFEGQDKAYSLDFEICNTYWDNSGECSDLVAEGHVKWDGCMNVCFYDDYMHFCCPDDADELNKALRWVWSQGKTLETWDELLDY